MKHTRRVLILTVLAGAVALPARAQISLTPMVGGYIPASDVNQVSGSATNIAKTRAQREGRTLPFSALENPGGVPEPAVDADRFLDSEHPRWPGHWASKPQSWETIPEERLLGRETRSVIEGSAWPSRAPTTRTESRALAATPGLSLLKVESQLAVVHVVDGHDLRLGVCA